MPLTWKAALYAIISVRMRNPKQSNPVRVEPKEGENYGTHRVRVRGRAQGKGVGVRVRVRVKIRNENRCNKVQRQTIRAGDRRGMIRVRVRVSWAGSGVYASRKKGYGAPNPPNSLRRALAPLWNWIIFHVGFEV